MPSFASIFSTSRRTLLHISVLTVFCVSIISIFIGIQLDPRSLRDSFQEEGRTKEYIQANIQSPEDIHKMIEAYQCTLSIDKRAQGFLTSALFYQGIILLIVPLFLIIYLTIEKNMT